MSTKSPDNKAKRFTKQRQAILEVLKNTYSHPDANWIYKKVSKKVPNISLGTVYRNLNILSEEQLIRELTCQSGVSRYDGNVMPHSHIICEHCHKIEDLNKSDDCQAAQELVQDIKENLGYDDLSCEILVRGTCPDCKKKLNN